MITVEDLMTTELETLNINDSMGRARELMAERHIRHIPIIDDDGRFVGLLTQRDVLANTISLLAGIDSKEQHSIEHNIPVEQIMTRDIATVGDDLSLKHAAGYLIDHKYGCLPVLKEGVLIGIVTETDFMKMVIHMLDQIEQT